jgi:glycosyltransferase involved in cell wall biosynthesis
MGRTGPHAVASLHHFKRSPRCHRTVAIGGHDVPMDTSTTPGFVVDNYPAPHRSMRIAFVTETYPPEVNGVAITLARLVDGLHRRNHDVQLVRPRQDSAEAASSSVRFHEVLTRGMPIPRYPNLRMGLPSKRALVQMWAVQRPDVVHIATEGPLGWSALNAALALKLPVCSDFRTNFHAYSRHYGVGWLHKPIMGYLRKFHNRTLCTMVPTDALKRELEVSGFRHLKVVSRGVDTRQYQPARRSPALREQWGVLPDDLVVAFVGRLAAEKNLGVLNKAFEAIRSNDARARLLFVGDGPMRAELQARWPDAIFAGQRSGEDLAAHYASADLFVFPSLTETFGNVTTEALASGLPVLAFDHAAAAQLIRNYDNGVVVACDNPEAFVRSAVGLAADPTLRRAMSLRARETACELDWDSIVERFEGVLASATRQGLEPRRHVAPSGVLPSPSA